MNINIINLENKRFLYIDFDIDFMSDLNIIEVYNSKSKYKIETINDFVYIPLIDDNSQLFIKTIFYKNTGEGQPIKIEKYKFYNPPHTEPKKEPHTEPKKEPHTEPKKEPKKDPQTEPKIKELVDFDNILKFN